MQVIVAHIAIDALETVKVKKLNSNSCDLDARLNALTAVYARAAVGSAEAVLRPPRQAPL